jgi:hypothetical protein
MMKGWLSQCESFRAWQSDGEPREFTLVGEHGAQKHASGNKSSEERTETKRGDSLRWAVEEG